MTHLLSTVIFKATNHLDKARGKIIHGNLK